MASQAKKRIGTPPLTKEEVTRRLVEFQQELGLTKRGGATEFARRIGVTPDAISLQLLSNWRSGKDTISMEMLLRLKPLVRARILLDPRDVDTAARQSWIREGQLLGLAAARQAIALEESRLRGDEAGSTEEGRVMLRESQRLGEVLAAEQAERSGRKQPAQKRRRKG